MATLERSAAADRVEKAGAGPRSRRRPPAPLAGLLATVLTLVVAWALVTPAWLGPDEPVHFAYVQTLGEEYRLPGGEGGSVSTALSRATDVTDHVHVVFDQNAQPDWTRVRADEFGRVERRSSADDGGGRNTASAYPPLYYAAETLPYLAAKDAGIFTQLSLVRLTSGLWLLLTVTAAWLLCGELFERRRLPQLVGAATVGLWPMMTFISASVNPDALLIALWTLILWLGVKVAKRGLTPARGLAIGALTGAALVTKASALVLVPVVLALVAAAAWHAHRAGRARPALALGLAVAAMALPFAAWTASTAAGGRPAYAQAGEISSNADGTGFQIREFASYLWQFYLPRLSFMTPVDHQFEVISDRPAINLWLGTGAGVFGWVNVWHPAGVYWAVGVALLVMLALFAAASARWWRQTGRGRRLRRLGPAAYLAAVAGVTLAALHFTDYTAYASGSGMFMQGRYLLPLGGVLAAVTGWALLALPARGRAVAAGLWIGGLLAFQVASLGLVLARWYA